MNIPITAPELKKFISFHSFDASSMSVVAYGTSIGFSKSFCMAIHENYMATIDMGEMYITHPYTSSIKIADNCVITMKENP